MSNANIQKDQREVTDLREKEVFPEYYIRHLNNKLKDNQYYWKQCILHPKRDWCQSQQNGKFNWVLIYGEQHSL